MTSHKSPFWEFLPPQPPSYWSSFPLVLCSSPCKPGGPAPLSLLSAVPSRAQHKSWLHSEGAVDSLGHWPVGQAQAPLPHSKGALGFGPWGPRKTSLSSAPHPGLPKEAAVALPGLCLSVGRRGTVATGRPRRQRFSQTPDPKLPIPEECQPDDLPRIVPSRLKRNEQGLDPRLSLPKVQTPPPPSKSCLSHPAPEPRPWGNVRSPCPEGPGGPAGAHVSSTGTPPPGPERGVGDAPANDIPGAARLQRPGGGCLLWPSKCLRWQRQPARPSHGPTSLPLWSAFVLLQPPGQNQMLLL